ncbi:MAG: DUF3482 domain-containing protein [Gammaproteobacteria bacterium]|nr:DUF3482 domain-containing protein [Gammaproteobacteria bacterium]
MGVALSLISHTNAGKTTLARTLLGRDVGLVRDAQHVTQEATPYLLLRTPQGEELILWDTPGFGDSARLARRLAQQSNPVGWFLSQVWDRFRDRAFYLSQLAVRNVREQADAVLYLVNASESPADAGYLVHEMEVLAWIRRPVIVVLNQTGRPRPREEEVADEARWRAALSAWLALDVAGDASIGGNVVPAVPGDADPRRVVRAVTTLDAFARCWVQEIELFDLIGAALPRDRRVPFARLACAWQERQRARFDESIDVLACALARAACDGEPLPVSGFGGRLRELGRSLGLGRDGADDARTRASAALATRLELQLRVGTDRLIALAGLDGNARSEVLSRLASGVALEAPIDAGTAAVMGGVMSGAVSGLAADLATGGFSFGAGMLAGAILGALGGAGLVRGVNLVRGRSGAVLRWDVAFLAGLAASSLLRYLAIAHYGRGRGGFVESEYPPFWPPLVQEAIERRQGELAAAWATRRASDADAVAAAVQPVLAAIARDVLERLYPGTRAFTQADGSARPVS